MMLYEKSSSFCSQSIDWHIGSPGAPPVLHIWKTFFVWHNYFRFRLWVCTNDDLNKVHLIRKMNDLAVQLFCDDETFLSRSYSLNVARYSTQTLLLWHNVMAKHSWSDIPVSQWIDMPLVSCCDILGAGIAFFFSSFLGHVLSSWQDTGITFLLYLKTPAVAKHISKFTEWHSTRCQWEGNLWQEVEL